MGKRLYVVWTGYDFNRVATPSGRKHIVNKVTKPVTKAQAQKFAAMLKRTSKEFRLEVIKIFPESTSDRLEKSGEEVIV